MGEYQIELFYEYEDGECGICHTFEVHDPDVHKNEDEIKERLVDSLDIPSGSVDFNYDSMYINLPESIIKKIKDDAVREYLEEFDNG